ncbi:MAG TPA: tryptophan synthase subunit alpha [Armatimonadota bacterium]|jgi:tryptophan synthase alpha chain
MMSRIGKRFDELKSAGEKALICFVTAGDPDLETTGKIVVEMAKAGADIVELGIPFSDPIADGPSIQAASMRSLEKGTNVASILGLVRSIRKESDVPLVLMTYFNPILHYGLEKFATDAASAGADGVILSDLTPEEAGEWKSLADSNGIDTIFLLAPTSTEPRIEGVAKLASGFIYCVSRTGVTGAQTEMAQGVRELVTSIRARTSKPIVVGFGISKPEHVREVCGYADGAIVGSLLVDLIASKGNTQAMFSELRQIVSALKSGTR